MSVKMIHPDTMFAVAGNTAGGEIFKYVKSLTGGFFWENQVPLEYSLEQNYPNPFNPSTTIKFAIPKDGNVSLKVFDVTGRQVAVLVNGLNLRAGTMSYDFDGSDLSSGIYFYSLIVDNNLISTKKMIMVK
jgi:Secretion system C-terminal sorting domain